MVNRRTMLLNTIDFVCFCKLITICNFEKLLLVFKKMFKLNGWYIPWFEISNLTKRRWQMLIDDDESQRNFCRCQQIIILAVSSIPNWNVRSMYSLFVFKSCNPVQKLPFWYCNSNLKIEKHHRFQKLCLSTQICRNSNYNRSNCT